MKVTQAIKKGFGIGKKNVSLILLVFVVNLIMSGIGFLMGLGPTAIPRPLEQMNLVSLGVFILFAMVVGIFLQGGVLGVIRDFVKWGENVKLSKFFVSYAKKFFLRLLGLGFLMIGITLLILVVAGGVSALISLVTGLGAGRVISTILLTLGMLAIFVVLFFLFPAYFIIVVEELGVMKAAQTSIGFVKRFWKKVLGLLVLWLLIYLGISIVVGLIALLLTYVGNFTIQRVVGGVLNGAVGSYMMVCITASWISFYLTLVSPVKATDVKESSSGPEGIPGRVERKREW